MANDKVSQLPTVSSATATDLIYAVQNGISVQETLQQVMNLFTNNVVLNFNGNPNGSVSGITYQFLWDTLNRFLWICTTTGSAVTAVWTPCIGLLTDGQLIIGSTSQVPSPATITAGNNITVTNTPGHIQIDNVITAGYVTNAMLATMANNTIKGNVSGVSASPTDLTATQVNTMLGVTNVGTATVGQIPGVNTNTAANSGTIGEYISSMVLFASSISLTTGTPANITSISLTAGDWQVWGNVDVNNGATLSKAQGWISSTSATLPDEALTVGYQQGGALPNFGYLGCGSLTQRFLLNSTTTVYLSVQVTGTSCTACGQIQARRMR